jgi:4-hydroxy-3-polyprenylbenzoate decarboxylase
VSLEKTRPGQAPDLAEALARTPASDGIRLLALVDADTDVANPDDVFWSLLNNIDPERDGRVLEGASGPLLALDGTRKLREEGFARDWRTRSR